MKRNILLDVSEDEIRLALLEDDKLVELKVERLLEMRQIGTIYRGKVCNIIPGMQVAFVDIGQEKNAFLYAGDAVAKNAKNKLNLKIESLLSHGQEITVQVTKESKGTKGPSVTTNISLPGRYIVLIPNSNGIGISKNIEDLDERDRLKKLAEEILPEGFGVIMRTISGGIEKECLQKEIVSLLLTYESIESKQEKGKVPRCLYKELGIVESLIRDMQTDQIDTFIINNKDEYDRIVENVGQTNPEFRSKFKFYSKDYKLYDFYGITLDIERMKQRNVWLKCGGNIVIEKTEALTVIDVNTGKFIGNGNLEDTILKTNIEAVVEIALQLRLRNISGIIVVDLINMKLADNKKKIIELLKNELKKDKAKTKVAGITNLGLIELTRQRVN